MKNVPDISGAWQSESGLIYIITQVCERFVWRVVHPKNGVTETGIGSFGNANAKSLNKSIHVKWNFHGGNLSAPVSPRTSGTVVLVKGKVTKIRWKDGDHFRRLEATPN